MLKKLTLVLGAVFILVGLLGFIANPLVGAGALFETDLGHNLVHLLAGVLLIWAGLKSEHIAGLALQVLGAVYLIVALIGFAVVDATGMGSILGLIHINTADNWLHVVLGVVLLGAGFLLKKPDALRMSQG